MTVIEEVKQRLDIVEVISRYVTLQKAGRNYKAACPFHAEKTPSFVVFPDRQSWHCFGACATGGDVFSFVMKKENVDFAEALRILAEKANVRLTTPGPKQQEESREREKLFQINEAAAQYFHHLLLKNPAAESARKYVERRGITAATLEAFRIGYALESWDSLRLYLLDKGFAEKEVIASGLLVPRETGGGSYDRFRNRLMFPICDVQGRVTGLGGRALDDSLPKYMNSPQSAVFDKSATLYGIDKARGAIRQKDLAILVEGYMDTVIAHQFGEANVVASMGIALTEKQLGILKKLTGNVALALDADAAGAEATLRMASAEEALAKDVMPVPAWNGLVNYENVLGAELRVVILPEGKDPDEVILDDVAKWRELVASATPILDYAIEAVTGRADLSRASDKTAAADKLLPLVREMKDPVRQAHYMQKLARLLRTDERVLWTAMRRLQPMRREPGAPAGPRSPAVMPGRNAIEEYSLALFLRYPHLKEQAGALMPEYFESSENRELFARALAAEDGSALRAGLDPYLQEYLDQLQRRAFPPLLDDNETERERTFAYCISRLREKWLKGIKRREEALAMETQSVGEAGELAKVEEHGTADTVQIKEVFDSRRKERFVRRNSR